MTYEVQIVYQSDTGLVHALKVEVPGTPGADRAELQAAARAMVESASVAVISSTVLGPKFYEGQRIFSREEAAKFSQIPPAQPLTVRELVNRHIDELESTVIPKTEGAFSR